MFDRTAIMTEARAIARRSGLPMSTALRSAWYRAKVEARQDAIIARRREFLDALPPERRAALERISAIENRARLTEADHAEIRRLRAV